MDVLIYTDGSSFIPYADKYWGGWGFVAVSGGGVVPGDYLAERMGGGRFKTGAAELEAIHQGLAWARAQVGARDFRHLQTITVMSDSEYALGALAKATKGQVHNIVANEGVIRCIAGLMECEELAGKVCWSKVKGHSADKYNDRADDLAGQGRKSYQAVCKIYQQFKRKT